MDIGSSVATTVIPCLACKAWEELRYLRKYKSYVRDFRNEQGKLSAEMKRVKLKIDEASKRNETLVDPRVEDWLKRANQLLQQDTKPTKCFGLCVNCCSQTARAKELESLIKEVIPKLITEVQEFDAFAHAVGVPGMEFHSQNFMSFKSRKAKFEELKKELEDDNNYMVGLQGFGGTGKSTMAIEVGKQVENTNSFDRVMFISVSTPVDKKRIQDDIAKKLELQLEEEKLLTHAEQIWNRIAYARKVLIILDDVWEKLDLKNLGIQPGFHRKGRCTVLLTTRYVNVCTDMECQKKIKLEELDENDALNLFLYHVGQDCRDDLKKVVVGIVNECGRLPVIVVAMAKSLKDWPKKDWHRALIALRSANEPSSRGIVDENMTKFYNSLKLSYNYLKDEQAQVLFLLCSVFPKAYEIPIELLSRIAIGLGLFGETEYDATRSQVCVKKNKLINSSLLLKAGEECVKMHDLIREVAMEIANEEIQVIMKSNMNLKENMKYSSWITNGFPNCFNGSKLKVLLVWINANGSLEVPNTVFAGMKSLRVLLLYSKIEFGRTLALSLPKSIQSLKDIRTLCLTNWELGDISMLIRNLKDLESLELTNCSILDLPNGISELGILRFLCLMRCLLEKNNPFEVIASCSKLEELYYISNDDHMPIDTQVPQINIPLPQYQIYHIDGSGFSAFDSCQLDASIKTSFKPAKLQRMFSREIIKSLAARAEILELEGDDESSWGNLIPDVVSIEDEATRDLIKLSLKKWSKMNCLIHTKLLQLTPGMAIFRKLAELQLVGVAVREICSGPYPDGFLKQLEKLELRDCEELESTLFKGKLELGNLKSIEVKDCSMSCLFHPSTAQSLRKLETLKITRCSNLKYIIRDEGLSGKVKADDKDPNPRSHDSMFQKLKLFSIKGCDELEFMLPICFCDDLPTLESAKISECENLKYMFGQYPEERGLHQMQKENILCSLKVLSILKVPSFVNIYPDCHLPQKSEANTTEGSKAKDKSPGRNVSCGSLCCFMPKSKATNEDESSTSKATQPDHTSPQVHIYVPPSHFLSVLQMVICIEGIK
ncbi:probable disease resistance protein At4g27220 [Neltuma alba]|uniref:probable disease resistance protein At4g27220 n=1 Tax=Neltuma alba TaxID=207710 RepID=UPI0010A3AC6E|nr:probable disease resistance protein At4g27220 [Prosopis alba]